MPKLFNWIFYAIGFGLLWYGIISALQSVEASNWPSVTGTITNLSLRENSDGDTTNYGVEVKYRYSVMGRTYTSSRLAFGYVWSSGRQADQDILNKLENASSVKIRYNPQNPGTSTLSFGMHHSVKLNLVFAITWLVFFFGLSLALWLESQPDDVLLNSDKQSVEASNWPSVTGKINNLSLRENSDSDATTYEVEVEYRYSVMGRKYTNFRLAFGYTSSSDRQSHQDIFNKLEYASWVKIRYNPEDPAISTLSFGMHRSVNPNLVSIISVLALFLGSTLFVWIDSQPDDVLLKNMEVTLKRGSY